MKTALAAAMMFAFLSVGYGIYEFHGYVGRERFSELMGWLAVGAMAAAFLLLLWQICHHIACVILDRGERK